MRITGGESRGRLISAPEGLSVRPTASKVRQAFFNILAAKVNACRFLDLCAGSGLIGLEALSRGAQSLTSVEENPRLVKILQENLTKLGYKADVICGDLRKVIPKLKAGSFDIVFADPPYASGLGASVLSLVEEYDLLADEGLLIIEGARYLPGCEPATKLELKETRPYGQTVLYFYQKAETIAR
ncbi:MAG: 16S rRNA (guanine(966)-N(2))-methyltransferase RsmD [Candidatus Obscuribacterales bacterium]|nr:16S rRNA (guanine(966)-N(2))-methyltransferase RsmD [Candidatus Obscuribacterales bacterium]